MRSGRPRQRGRYNGEEAGSTDESMRPKLGAFAKKERPVKGSAAKGLLGSQTLLRGLDIVEAVAAGATNLAALSQVLGLNRSTTHRLATTLVECSI